MHGLAPRARLEDRRSEGLKPPQQQQQHHHRKKVAEQQQVEALAQGPGFALEILLHAAALQLRQQDEGQPVRGKLR